MPNNALNHDRPPLQKALVYEQLVLYTRFVVCKVKMLSWSGILAPPLERAIKIKSNCKAYCFSCFRKKEI
jgi:hypothetical protein